MGKKQRKEIKRLTRTILELQEHVNMRAFKHSKLMGENIRLQRQLEDAELKLCKMGLRISGWVD